MKAALQLLLDSAPDFGVTDIITGEPEIRFMLPVPRVDGRTSTYDLTAKANGQKVSVRETFPNALPAFCPERHINDGGTFCLSWHAVDPMVVTNNLDAERWWGTLVQFLRLQERAERRKQWPDRRVWAHGSAADHQRRASEHGLVLGLGDDILAGRLSVERRLISSQGPSLRVTRSGKPLYSVWEKQRLVVNLRRPCLCPHGFARRPTIIRACGNHAAMAVELALELMNIDRSERRFWDSYRGRGCCGTIDTCPLAAA